MTSRERLATFAQGGPVDLDPVIGWHGLEERSDAVVVKPVDVAKAIVDNPDKAVLGEVLSPFSRAIQFRLGLSALLRENPEAGQVELDRLVQVTREDIETAILAGADGIYYRLQGAEPGFSSPMEYGGLYLERDRELLEAVKEARVNVLCVEGGDEVYLDALSDLPAHLFVLVGPGTPSQPMRVRPMSEATGVAV